MNAPHQHRPASALTTVAARIVAQWTLLAGIFGIFVALVLFGQIGIVAALVGFLLVLGGVAVLPARTATVAQTVQLPLPLIPAAQADDDAVFAFADALPDPCL